MIKPNNSRIDLQELIEKTSWVLANRRCANLLVVPIAPGRAQPPLPGRQSRFRSWLKSIPLVGVWLTGIWRFWRKFSSPGLGWRTRVRLLPGLGPFSYWLHSLAQSGKFRTQVMQQLALLHHRNEELQQRLTEAAMAQEAANERARQADIYLNNVMADITRVARNVERRLSEYAPSPVPCAAGAPLQNSTFMEGFYLAFENQFRGSRESIKSRQRPYLQYLKKMAAVKSSPLTVLDIGCGRGEWLELLSEQGYDITGIDSDLEMVKHVRAEGFSVEHGDAITYLKGLPDRSLDVVTGFHIIEHLPLESLLQLFDEVLRTLRQTGIAIFETPNPENLQVGACNFYNDPTHLHPIPPPVAQFMARQRGFAHTSILRLNPYPEDHQVAQEGELAKRFNELMFGPQDYALLAWKRHED